MYITSIIIATIAILVGITYRQISINTNVQGDHDEITGEAKPISVTPSPTLTDLPSPTPAPSSTPTFSPTSTALPTPTTKTGESSDTSDWHYPGARVVSSSSNTLVLESSDDLDGITYWYKSRIKSLGMNVTSFVTTKTNDNVLNKLAGADASADASKEINVTVERKPGDSNTRISITIEN